MTGLACGLPTVAPSALASSTRTVSTSTTIPATVRIRLSVSAPLGSFVGTWALGFLDSYWFPWVFEKILRAGKTLF